MMNRYKHFFNIMLVALIAGLLLVPLSAATTLSWSEGFEAGTAGTNPSNTWYTYTEKDKGAGTAGFTYANVSTVHAYAGTHSFFVNGSIYDNNYSDYAAFTISSGQWASFQLTVNVNGSNFSSDHRMHNNTYICFKDGTTNISRWYINRNKIFFYSADSATQQFNFTVGSKLPTRSKSWYTLKVEFDWVNQKMRGVLYNSTSGTDVQTNITAWIAMSASITGFTGINITGTQKTAGSTRLYFDSFLLTKTTGTFAATTNYMINTILPILIAVALIVILVAMAFTAGMDYKMWISIMVAIIIGIIVIQVILQI